MSHTPTAPVRRRRLVRTVATVALAASALLPSAGSALAAPKDDTVALRTLDDIVKGHYKAATAHFDKDMRTHLSADELKQSWQAYQKQFGRYQSHKKPKDTKSGSFTVVSVPLRMKRSAGEFRVSFDKKGAVNGLFFLRPGVPLPTSSPT